MRTNSIYLSPDESMMLPVICRLGADRMISLEIYTFNML